MSSHRKHRHCHFEEMEPRQLLSGLSFVAPPDINLGIFSEDQYSSVGIYAGQDAGNIFEVAWNGGADGTALSQLTINLRDQLFFDIDGSGKGLSHSLTILVGSELVALSQVSDDLTSITFVFKDGVFTADKTLRFHIDIDEYLAPMGGAMDETVTGPELEGSPIIGESQFTATFSSGDFLDASLYGMFRDKFTFDTSIAGKLPTDLGEIGMNNEHMTAGAQDAVALVAKPSSISGLVYEDWNNDGIKDADEAGIVGVTLSLERWDDATSQYVATGLTETTDANGYYEFTELASLTRYRVAETQPAGYASGKNTAGSFGGTTIGVASDAADTISGIDVPANSIGVAYNFGEIKSGSITGTVYEDDNSNGVIDAGEVGIGGVTLTLWQHNADDSWSQVGTTTTNDVGRYTFSDIDPRLTYRITETQPANYSTTHNTAGNAANQQGVASDADDWIASIQTGIGQDATDYNFGERYHRASIAGTVYEDKNANGIIDAGENGIADVALTLQKLNADGSWSFVSATTTDIAGRYAFSEIDPRLTYRVVETQPDGYKTTHNTAGNAAVNAGVADDANDWITQIDVAPLQNAAGYNFGERFMLGSLTGTVYEDADNDGIIDHDEKRLEGVRVELCFYNTATEQFESTGIFTFTDANGNYSFGGLVPGTYCVTRATTPAGYCDGKETLGDHGGQISTNAPRMYDITVVGDAASQNYNFGLGTQGSISGYVFIDPNANGVKDAGETVIAGVQVTLYVLRDGVYVATTKTATTDADGFYKFDELCPFKTYAVFETQPDAYDDDADYVGTINGVYIGNNQANDFITGIALGNGDAAIAYNFTEKEKPIPPDPPVPPPPTPVPNPVPIPWTIPTTPMIPYSAFASSIFAAAPPMLSLMMPLTNAYGGGSVAPSDVSWHLSVLNGGHPRQIDGSSETQSLASAHTASDVKYVSVAWDAAPMEEMVWYTRDKSGRVVKKGSFGASGAKPVVADFNGDGIDEMAVFQNGQWFIDINGNGVWDGDDIWCELGAATDQPVTGDWDGDGKIDIGTFGPQWAGDAAAIPRDPGLPSDLNNTIVARPKSVPSVSESVGVRAVKHSRSGDVRFDEIDHVFRYGGHGDVAITGDWSGDGITKIGVYRNGKWQLDYNGDGRFDANDITVDGENVAGAIPVTGDFSGDGKTNIGLFRDGEWLLDTTGDFVFDTTISFGQAGDIPTTGDFSGNGIAELAVLRPRVADALFTSTDTKIDDSPTMSEVAPRVASQFVAEDASDDAKTLRHERTHHTPFTNVPLGARR